MFKNKSNGSHFINKNGICDIDPYCKKDHLIKATPNRNRPAR